MRAEQFIDQIVDTGIRLFTGVPDSTLKEFLYCLEEGNIEADYLVCADEGASVSVAIGRYLSTNIPACVFMQNSGLGNAVNPITSLANEKVYDIPMLLVIGYRGTPGEKDEPQHKFMGEITEGLLDLLKIPYSIISGRTTEEKVQEIMKEADTFLKQNKQYAVLVKAGTFESVKEKHEKRNNGYELNREYVICQILKHLTDEDILVSSTGKISREVYESSDALYGDHRRYFLTVGGMGYASSIALGIADSRPEKSVYCIEGDGAVLMHMGSIPCIAKRNPANLIHICLNNDMHESVGGTQTGAAGFDYYHLAKDAGYKTYIKICNESELKQVIQQFGRLSAPAFLEIKVSPDSREDLGRPKEHPSLNKVDFMNIHHFF